MSSTVCCKGCSLLLKYKPKILYKNNNNETIIIVVLGNGGNLLLCKYHEIVTKKEIVTFFFTRKNVRHCLPNFRYQNVIKKWAKKSHGPHSHAVSVLVGFSCREIQLFWSTSLADLRIAYNVMALLCSSPSYSTPI